MAKRKRVGDQELEQQAEPVVPAWLGGDEPEPAVAAPVPDPKPGPRVRNIGIRKVRVADIQDNPANYRSHPDEQTAAFNGAETELGFYSYPDVFVDPQTGALTLVDGELRKYHLLGKYGDDVEIEVNVVDFSPAEARKALATKDALAGMAETDPKVLDALLRDIQTSDEALAKMLTDLAQDAGVIPPEALANTAGLDPPEIVEDEVPEPPAVPITKPGDLWLMGDVHYECPDCHKRYTLDEGKALDGWCPCTPREAA